VERRSQTSPRCKQSRVSNLCGPGATVGQAVCRGSLIQGLGVSVFRGCLGCLAWLLVRRIRPPNVGKAQNQVRQARLRLRLEFFLRTRNGTKGEAARHDAPWGALLSLLEVERSDPNQIKPNIITQNQTKLSQAKPNQIKLNQTRGTSDTNSETHIAEMPNEIGPGEGSREVLTDSVCHNVVE